MAVAPLRPAIFCSLESTDVDDVLRDAPALELEAGELAGPARLADVSLLLVDSGLALIRAEQPETFRDIVVCHAGPGALVLAPRASEVVAALVPTQVTLISADLRDRLLAIPAVAPLMFDALAATLRQKHRTIEALARPHHRDRVRAKLLQLAADHGVVGLDGIRLDLPLTHELLGEMTGSARETVTRSIDELQSQGFVVRRGRSYRLAVDPHDLPM
jgi:CRP-like cAMP-binding protein